MAFTRVNRGRMSATREGGGRKCKIYVQLHTHKKYSKGGYLQQLRSWLLEQNSSVWSKIVSIVLSLHNKQVFLPIVFIMTKEPFSDLVFLSGEESKWPDVSASHKNTAPLSFGSAFKNHGLRISIVSSKRAEVSKTETITNVRFL